MARLFDAAPGFREKTNCISCHHNAMPALTAATVRRKGIEVDEVRVHKNLDDILSFFKSNAPRMMLGDPAVGGEALTTGYAQMALAAEGHPLDTVTATMTHWLIARQMPDGRWLGNGLNRPPSEYSTISHTAIAAGGLKSYPLPGRKNEVTESLRRAREWLLAAEPKSTEERGMRLMGLVWTDAPRPRVAAAIKEIRDRQEAGGGWSQFARTGAGCLRHGTVSLRAARRGRAADRRRVSEGRRVPARDPVSGRRLAREDPFLPGAAVLRKRVSVRPASMDLRGGNELGVVGDRADVAGRTLTSTKRPGVCGEQFAAWPAQAPDVRVEVSSDALCGYFTATVARLGASLGSLTRSANCVRSFMSVQSAIDNAAGGMT